MIYLAAGVPIWIFVVWGLIKLVNACSTTTECSPPTKLTFPDSGPATSLDYGVVGFVLLIFLYGVYSLFLR